LDRGTRALNSDGELVMMQMNGEGRNQILATKKKDCGTIEFYGY